MAGSLFLVDKFTVSSDVSSVTIGGGSSGSSSYNFTIDSTYNVYKLIIYGLRADTNSSSPQIRVTKSGTAQSDSEYDEAAKQLKAYNTFGNNDDVNLTSWGFNTTGTNANSSFNLIAYLFNFADASEYSFATFEEATSDTTLDFRGKQGGGVHTVASASDGINISVSSGNIASGELVLYGLKN